MEKMKTTVKRGLILRFEGIINIITFIGFTTGGHILSVILLLF